MPNILKLTPPDFKTFLALCYIYRGGTGEVIMPDNRFRYSKDVDSFPSRGFELDLPRSKTFKSYFHEKI